MTSPKDYLTDKEPTREIEEKKPYWKQHPEIWDTHCPTCDGMFKGKHGLAIHRKKLCRKYPHPTKKGYCCACDYDIAGFNAILTSEVESTLEKIEQFWIDNEFTPSYEDWEKFRKALSELRGVEK